MPTSTIQKRSAKGSLSHTKLDAGGESQSRNTPNQQQPISYKTISESKKAIKKGLHSAALTESKAINNDSDRAYRGLPQEH